MQQVAGVITPFAQSERKFLGDGGGYDFTNLPQKNACSLDSIIPFTLALEKNICLLD